MNCDRKENIGVIVLVYLIKCYGKEESGLLLDARVRVSEVTDIYMCILTKSCVV